MVLAIIGGVIGIIIGIIAATDGSMFGNSSSGFVWAWGYIVLAFSIAVIVGGCCAKYTKWGSWTMLISGIAMLILGAVLIAVDNPGREPVISYILSFTHVILAITGGILGVLMPKKEMQEVTKTDI